MEPSLDGEWSVGEAGFAALVGDLRGLDPRVIVEFGSGASSVRLAQAFPLARLLSVDDSERFASRTQELIRTHGVSERVDVQHRELSWRFQAGALYQSYRPGPVPSNIDAVFVDGPPSSTRRGREACLHTVVGSLRVGGRVYLDDYRRPAERNIVRNWLAAYPGGFQVRVLDAGHQICVLEKLRPLDGPRFHPRVLVDSALANGRRALGVGWRALKSLRGAESDRARSTPA